MTDAMEPLVSRLKRIHALHEAASALRWDQETYMPAGGTPARAEQLATLEALAHEHLTHPDLARALGEAEKAAADERAHALVRETRRIVERATRVPPDLVEALSRATTRALPVWVEARRKRDFSLFRPHLEDIVDLRRRYAASIDASAHPYEVLFQDYEPWLPLAEARRLLRDLRDGLIPMVEDATAATADVADPFAGAGWPADAQADLTRRVLAGLGYPEEHGRVDVSAHPFSTGNPYDARITTRYDPHDPLSGLLSTIHEFGHALYTLGLPKDENGTPLGDDRGLSVHESQSRFWENHVGRSRAFMDWLLPTFREAFPGRLDHADPEAVWRHANRVRPSLIRVEADELTYHQHVALRFEIEEALVTGDLRAADAPAAWSERMGTYLGVAVPDDARGVLQDVHWSHGLIGYFPTYSLGSMLAAQLAAAFADDGHDLEGLTARGDFAPLSEWLGDRVHRHGQRYVTGDLVERATGSALTADAFLAYARGKVDALTA